MMRVGFSPDIDALVITTTVLITFLETTIIRKKSLQL
jgi:hypothetical protein